MVLYVRVDIWLLRLWYKHNASLPANDIHKTTDVSKISLSPLSNFRLYITQSSFDMGYTALWKYTWRSNMK